MDWFTKIILHLASSAHSKSTTLRPLQAPLIILLIVFLAELKLAAPFWSLAITLGMLVLSIIAYYVAYFYFMTTDPELLRTETYSLQRLAIEKNVGDSISGLAVLPDVKYPTLGMGTKEEDNNV